MQLRLENHNLMRKTNASRYEGIAWLNGRSEIDIDRFGGKAAMLNLIGRRLPIAKGFAVSSSLLKRLVKGVATIAEERAVRCAVLELLSRNEKIIVRSSSLFENSYTHQFAGVFKSVQNVMSYAQFLEAARDVYYSAYSDHARKFADYLGVNYNKNHIALLVQVQKEVTVSGVAQDRSDHIKLEIWNKHLAAGMLGHEKPEENIIIYYDTAAQLEGCDSSGFLTSENISVIRDVMEYCKKRVGAGCIVEFGFNDNEITVFQVRPYLRRNYINFLSKEHGGNVKAAAMKYFSQSGLFQRPLALIPPDASSKEVAEVINSTVFQTNELTVRFAFNEQIGLPRSFCHSKSEAVEFIINNRLPMWSTIIHDYIRINRSFELLISENDALLEHVPGIWESNNRIRPDQIVINGNEYKARIRKKSVNSMIPTPAGSVSKKMAPINNMVCRIWVKHLFPIISQLRKDFSEFLPLNFHFIESEEGEWLFLNIRSGFEFPTFLPMPANVFCVSSHRDLDDWDGVSAILLRSKIARGDEHSLITLAEELRQKKAIVYTEFGLLSHPAMILREYGVTIYDTYCSDYNKISETKDFSYAKGRLDLKGQWYRRVIKKPRIMESNNLVIISDRDPITPGHKILFSKNVDIQSMSDLSDYQELIELLKKYRSSTSQNFLYFEKGRMPACTGMHDNCHAHAHILPMEHEKLFPMMDGLFKLLANQSDKTDFMNLDNALRRVSNENFPYILIGALDYGFQFFLIERHNIKPIERMISYYFSSLFNSEYG